MDNYNALRAVLFGTIIALASSHTVSQPSVISPQDVARLKQQTDFTNEWYDSNLYDLENPIELFVTIRGVDIPEQGYAELFFTLDSLGRGTVETPFDPDRVFIATLQLASSVRRLGANSHSFKQGTQARLLGWPATPKNVTDSVLLVDELTFLHGGKPLRFHPVRPDMKNLRANEPRNPQ